MGAAATAAADAVIMFKDDEKHWWLLPLLLGTSGLVGVLFGLITGLFNGFERLLTETGVLKAAADGLIYALPKEIIDQDRKLGQSAKDAWERVKEPVVSTMAGEGPLGGIIRLILGIALSGIPVGQVLDEATRTVRAADGDGSDKTLRFSRQVTALFEAFVRGRISDVTNSVALIGVVILGLTSVGII